MAGTASATDISKAHLDYVFQAHAITSDRADAVATFIESNGDTFQRVAIVAENTDYGIGNVDDLKARLADTPGIEVRDWIFDKETRDLSPLLLQVKTWNPDLIFNVTSTATEYLMVQQADDVGLLDTATMVISDDRPVRQEFWDNVGETGLHSVFVTYYHPSQRLTAAGDWFKAEYTARFGEEPVYTSYQGFGNTIIMAQAINRACSTEGAAMVQALEAGPFISWNTDTAAFPKGDDVDWHRIRIPILLLQYTAAPQPYEEAAIVFPPDLKTADLILPTG
jgi:branched-chain amino acid transport system substrate-binding protein